MSGKDIANQIMYQSPFRNVMRIKEITPLDTGYAISKETFKIISIENKQYKLRYCNGLLRAWRIEKNVKRFPQHFPKFYGREGRYLLFDWLPGDDLLKLHRLGKLEDENYTKLGRIYGEIHSVNEEGDIGKAKSYYKKCAEGLLKNGLIDEHTEKLMMALYDKKAARTEHKVVLEVYDLNLANFIINPKDGKIIIIDEEGMDHKLKGLGMAKIFTLYLNPAQKKAFLDGYREFHSDKYFTPELEDFMELIVLARDAWIKFHSGKEYGEPLKRLIEYLEKNK